MHLAELELREDLAETLVAVLEFFMSIFSLSSMSGKTIYTCRPSLICCLMPL
jgi:hypothetical protein